MGMIVAPGVFFSTAFYNRVSGENKHPTQVYTNLDLPPPLPRVNIPIDTNCHVSIGVMAFRFKLEVWCEVMTPIYFGNAGDDIVVEELKGLAVNCNL